MRRWARLGAEPLAPGVMVGSPDPSPESPEDFNCCGRHAFYTPPWVHSFINPGGEIQLWCTAEEHQEMGKRSLLEMDEIRRITEHFDAPSNQSLADHAPELASLMNSSFHNRLAAIIDTASRFGVRVRNRPT